MEPSQGDQLGDIFATNIVIDGVKFPGLVVPDSLEELKTFDVRPDDVWICTYPKSGTHFATEIVSLILGNGDPFKVNRLTTMSTAAMLLLDKPFIDLSQHAAPTPFLDVLKKAPSPRMILTHLPLQFLPPNIEKRAKVLYVARNPKDMLTSMVNFVQKTMQVPLAQLLQEEMTEGTAYGGWYKHVTEFWEKRNEKNVLFLKFEDMKRDLTGAVRQVAELLEQPLTDDLLQRIVTGSDFDGMKKTYEKIESSSKEGIMLTRAAGQLPFMQKGKVGTWKTKFSVAESEMLDAWYNEKMAGTGLSFDFE